MNVSRVLCLLAVVAGFVGCPNPQERPSKSQSGDVEATAARQAQDTETGGRSNDTTSAKHTPVIDGTWRYVLGTDGNSVSDYYEYEALLVVSDGKWVTISNGSINAVDSVEFDCSKIPYRMTRSSTENADPPIIVARAIVKFDSEHLIYTETPLENPANPTRAPFPSSFLAGEGSENMEYILRRVSDSTAFADNNAVNRSTQSRGN